MCGAPVFPANPTRFVYRPQAADVTDVSSPPPSTPSGWYSSLETGAPPHDTLAESPAAYAALLSWQHKQQLMMAEAARGLLAAPQQMARPPDRQASAKAAARGARVPPPIKMCFVPKQMPAADVMDAGASAPSTPSDVSSLETTPWHHHQQQQQMAEAARELLAAAHQMPRPPDRQASSSKAAARGAPVPPPIKMRFVPYTMSAADVMEAGSSAPSTPSDCSSSWETTPWHHQQQMAEAARGLLAAAHQMPRPDRQASAKAATRGVTVPPPIKMLFVPNTMPAAADVMDAGPLAPSTPSPRGPLPPSLSDLACASQHTLTPGAAWGLATKPPLPFPTAPAPAPRVEVRQVWAHNFEHEAKLIESLLPMFPYVAVDTEFPGTVYRPAGPAYPLKPEERYRLLRSNVDALDLIQLGLTLFDDSCRLPGVGGTTRYVWEFNFREFDVRRHRHAPERVAALRARGVDLDLTRRHGVDAAAAFGPRLRKWARAGLGRAGVVTASGGYDLAYLVKLMFGAGFRMPASAAEFEAVARAALLRGRRRRVFDVREMARLCPTDDLRRALDGVAAELNVARPAGYDSLLTCYTFVKLREVYFDDDAKLASVDGILAEITAF